MSNASRCSKKYLTLARTLRTSVGRSVSFCTFSSAKANPCRGRLQASSRSCMALLGRRGLPRRGLFIQSSILAWYSVLMNLRIRYVLLGLVPLAVIGYMLHIPPIALLFWAALYGVAGLFVVQGRIAAKNNYLRDFLKYDRVFLALSVISVILFVAFLYYLGNTHQPGCDYYYHHTAEILLQFLIAVPTLLLIYVFIKLRLRSMPKATNGQLFGLVLGCAGIAVAAVVIYVVVGLGLFFGTTC